MKMILLIEKDVYYVEFINTIRNSGIPNHIVRHKVGCPIMLFRNIGQSSELRNGTQLIVSVIGNHDIEAKTIHGKNIRVNLFIPRILLTPSDLTSFLLDFREVNFLY